MLKENIQGLIYLILSCILVLSIGYFKQNSRFEVFFLSPVTLKILLLFFLFCIQKFDVDLIFVHM
jgi:uncharacterized membrane protein YesL